MRRVFKLMMLMAVAVLVLSVLGGTALWHQISHEVGNSGITVSVNGDDIDVHSLAGMDGFSGLGALIGLFVAGLVVCIVLPLVLLFSIGLPLLIVGAVFACLLAGVFSIGAVISSPFVLFVLLIVWLLRKKPQRRAPRNSPNIAA
jgi:hypothetical protein